MIERVLFLKNY